MQSSFGGRDLDRDEGRPGAHHVMLSVPSSDLPTLSEAPIAALREPLDESRAIVWVKDLDGRYVYVNRRFTTDLHTSEDRLRGHTDAELPERETVDGPRGAQAADGLGEPLQLEYVVPAFEGRPALVALRFVTRDPAGQPAGVCGVAAPLHEARLAREEAERLMRIERWGPLDPVDARAELLEEWGVAPDDAGAELARPWGETAVESGAEPAHPAPPGRADSVEQLQRELEQARAEVEQARAELEVARNEREHAREEREQAREEREQARTDADRSRALAAEARSATMLAQGEAEFARIQLARIAERDRGLDPSDHGDLAGIS
jgi:hypothetical protein